MANVKAAKEFVKNWQGRGDEKQETQAFWIELLDKVFEDHEYNKHIVFEQVADKIQGGSNFKDVVINRYSDHAVLIEQKSSSLALDKPEPRFGTMVTPFEQAKHYDDLSAVNDKARWIITCNFKEFWIYDMLRTGKNLTTPVAMLHLNDLPKHLDWLNIISPVKTKPLFIDEVAVSNEAGRLVGVMYDALRKRYADPDSDETSRNLNKLCVRIVFCLYAEDAGLFNKNNRKIFHDYLAQFDAKGMRKGLRDLFRVLNQRENERDKYLADDDPLLASFPYVNGGLFEGDVEIPPFDDEIREILLVKESMSFDWSVISPTIFGAVFESTLNPETRRQGGMHYTSIENIHKVIDPLFLDDLTIELNEILKGKQVNVREKNLLAFQEKMAGLKFLDPAAGSGNFLTETYLSLRKLENRAIQAIQGERVIGLGFEGETDRIKVSIQQFYGIEINDFAVAVAKTALWIAEAQMFEKTQEILSSNKEFLPLHEYDNIKEGNALRMDWNDVVPASELNYIMGNPPFIGYSLQNRSQKEDILSIYVDEKGKPYKTAGKIDYVAGWYWKAAEMMETTNIRTALVSTNSITQGEQVAAIWKPLYDRYGIHIDFAYKTFIWNSEANDKAHVHCVIVGFSASESSKKPKLYSGELSIETENINPYLISAENVFIEGRSVPICDAPILLNGGKPAEGGNLILSVEEKEQLLLEEPQAAIFIRPYMMGKDFIDRSPRFCLWLVNSDPSVLKTCKSVLARVENVRQFRLKSIKEATRKKANTPTLFDEVRECESDYVAIAKVSSERRSYVPIDYLKANIIPGDSLFMLPDSTLYHFGVLTSCVHMAWMRAVAGRLKSDYRYSSTVVYNTFPWPEPTPEQKGKIEKTAKGILDARALYPDSSLADLYDPLTMPIELRKAHEANDKAVMEAYGFKNGMTESEIVAELMKMYQNLIEKQYR